MAAVNELQRIGLNALTVTSTFELVFGGDSVTVAVGADDTATAANIATQLSTIPALAAVTVAPVNTGSGFFDVDFNTTSDLDERLSSSREAAKRVCLPMTVST